MNEHHLHRAKEIIERKNFKEIDTSDMEPFKIMFRPAFRGGRLKRWWGFISAKQNLKKVLGIVVTVAEFLDPKLNTVDDFVLKYILPKIKR